MKNSPQSITLIYIFFVMFCANPALAQSNQSKSAPSELSAPIFVSAYQHFSPGKIAYADVDGDNDMDILITGSRDADPIARLYINYGNGSFGEKTDTPFEAVYNSAAAFADIDGDNDFDLLITGNIKIEDSVPDYTSILYTNDGKGNYTKVTETPFDGVAQGSIVFFDIDSDNDKDVLIIGYNGLSDFELSSKLYQNDGKGNFAEITGTPFGGVYDCSIAVSDIDGDKDQDVLIAGRPTKLYTNDGNGNFTEITETPFRSASRGSLAFSDVDGDNDMDVLIAGDGLTTLYINDGTGKFTEVTATPFENVSEASVAFSDIENDNDEDVIITGLDGYGRISKLYLNDGTGIFTEVIDSPFEGVYTGSVAFIDIDEDNDNDLLIAGYYFYSSHHLISNLYTNDGTGKFTKIQSPLDNFTMGSIAFSDIDGDNDEDVLITGYNGYNFYSKLYWNDGTGKFTEIMDTPFVGVYRSSIAFADIDGDNDNDILITGMGAKSIGRITKLYTNNGTGIFSEVADTPFDNVGYSSVAFSDVDGDNDEDVLIAGYAGAKPISKLYTNDGNGVFTQITETPFEGVEEGSVAFADIDGDTDVDLLITGRSYSNGLISKLYTNNGTGDYIEVTENPFEGVARSSIAFSDVDNDEDEDVLIAGNNGSGPITKLYINDGTGKFTLAIETPFDGVEYGSVAFADVDNDSDNDLLITGNNGYENISKLYLNDGYGGFTELTVTPFEGTRMSAVAFSDIDGDTDIDLLITGNGYAYNYATTGLFLNLTSDNANPVKVNNYKSKSFEAKLYPNPTTGITTLEIKQTLQKISLLVYDMTGTLVMKKQFSSANKISFEMGDKSPGVYLVLLKSDDKVTVKKLVVEHH